MSYKTGLSKEEIAKVKSLDLLTYLKNYDPDELIKRSSKHYGVRTHDSVDISNGMWHQFSTGIGKRSALDYLIYVEGYKFKDAMIHIDNLIKEKEPVFELSEPFTQVDRRKNDVPFRLPKAYRNNDRAIEYLCNVRMISREIVECMIEQKKIYEANSDHSVIFVGYDENDKPRFANKRGTDSKIKMDISGSDKSYGFNYSSQESKVLFVFESAIDMMSYMTIMKESDEDYSKFNFLSLDGIGGSTSKALDYYLSHHCIERIFLNLDNDAAGKNATKEIILRYGKEYMIYDEHPTRFKDVNERLVHSKEMKKSKEEYLL